MGGAAFIGRVGARHSATCPSISRLQQVVSNRMQKTAVVAVHYAVWVNKYKVYQRRVSRHQVRMTATMCSHAHDAPPCRSDRPMTRGKSAWWETSSGYRPHGKINLLHEPSNAANSPPTRSKLSKHKAYKVTGILRRASVYDPEKAARIAEERDAGAAPSAVDFARAKLDAAAERLRALREMYEKDAGRLQLPPGRDGGVKVAATATASTSVATTGLSASGQRSYSSSAAPRLTDLDTYAVSALRSHQSRASTSYDPVRSSGGIACKQLGENSRQASGSAPSLSSPAGCEGDSHAAAHGHLAGFTTSIEIVQPRAWWERLSGEWAAGLRRSRA